MEVVNTEKLDMSVNAETVLIKKFAEALNTNIETIEPYVYIGITAATNYMIFGDNSFIKPQFDLIKQQLRRLSG